MVLCAVHQFLGYGLKLSLYKPYAISGIEQLQAIALLWRCEVVCMGLMQGVQLCMAHEEGPRRFQATKHELNA